MPGTSNIVTKKPTYIETVGAMYLCFNIPDADGNWTPNFEAEVIKLNTVKSVEVTENYSSVPIYASGEEYDDAGTTTSNDIAVETIAFPPEVFAKMRGDKVGTGGLIRKGGRRNRPFFAFGEVVRMKDGTKELRWSPKCKLSEAKDAAKTSESSFSEQTKSATVRALPFNEDADIEVSVNNGMEAGKWCTEDLFFNQVIIDDTGLAAIKPNA